MPVLFIAFIFSFRLHLFSPLWPFPFQNTTSIDSGPVTPDYSARQKSFIIPILTDKQPIWHKIGDVKLDAREGYNPVREKEWSTKERA